MKGQWRRLPRGPGEQFVEDGGLERLDWEYDEDADALYLSISTPRKASGVDVGQGVIVRYDEKKKEVVGLTILGMRARLVESLKGA